MAMATSSASEQSASFEHVDIFSDHGDSESCRLLNITVDTHNTADIQSRTSQSDELLDASKSLLHNVH